MALWLCRTFFWTLDTVWALSLNQWMAAIRGGRRFRAIEATERAAAYHDPEGTCERARETIAETEAEDDPGRAAASHEADVTANLDAFVLAFGRYA